jgi:hypothetical protein
MTESIQIEALTEAYKERKTKTIPYARSWRDGAYYDHTKTEQEIDGIYGEVAHIGDFNKLL